ncbi:unnamed protein product [Echinostoma caproni]|uniref:Uncharacterized protein n=1 Tax=Echinostoma caproni TaxID=27848 RepID=A0A183ARD0_9TREM|nr:unnamed protein product [Echinostoma caproni]
MPDVLGRIQSRYMKSFPGGVGGGAHAVADAADCNNGWTKTRLWCCFHSATVKNQARFDFQMPGEKKTERGI